MLHEPVTNMMPFETIGVASSPRDGVGAELPGLAKLFYRVAIDVLQRRKSLFRVSSAMRQPVARRVIGVDDAVAIDVGGIFEAIGRAVVLIGLGNMRWRGRRGLLGVVAGPTGCQSNQK